MDNSCWIRLKQILQIPASFSFGLISLRTAFKGEGLGAPSSSQQRWQSAFNRVRVHLQARQKRLKHIFLVSLTIALIAFTPLPVLAAETIYFEYGPLLFPLSVQALETYAQTGTITPEFATYAHRFSPQQLHQLRQLLQHQFAMDESTLYRMTEAVPIVNDFLKGMGQMIETPAGLNGFYALRGALLLAAAESGNWTVLDVIHRFPTDIRIDTARAMQYMKSSPSQNTNECSASRLFY